MNVNLAAWGRTGLELRHVIPYLSGTGQSTWVWSALDGMQVSLDHMYQTTQETSFRKYAFFIRFLWKLLCPREAQFHELILVAIKWIIKSAIPLWDSRGPAISGQGAPLGAPFLRDWGTRQPGRGGPPGGGSHDDNYGGHSHIEISIEWSGAICIEEGGEGRTLWGGLCQIDWCHWWSWGTWITTLSSKMAQNCDLVFQK